MMERDIHLKPKDLLDSLRFRQGDFGDIAIISGQPQRAKMCVEQLENPVKNFTFLGYTMWTGTYKGKKVTVGNGGFFSADSAFMTELVCVGGIDSIIRIGSCGALRKDIGIGDFIVADSVFRGDGATRYYVDDQYESKVDNQLTEKMVDVFQEAGEVHKGGVWTTDALFRETKEIVNSYIDKGAIAVDMVTSPFVTIANIYKKKVAAVLTVSDNLITGELGFSDRRFFDAEMKMIEGVLALVAQ
jgi:DeoD family purine-nucleoside phosphorylase